MLHITKTGKQKYQAVDPYIQRSLIGVDYVHEPDYGVLEDELDTPDNVDEYLTTKLDKLRVKRQGPLEPLQGDPIVYERFLTPLYAITAFFAAMFIIGPFLVRKGPNRGIVQASIMLSAFCMWIFWFTIYFGQMNPLMGPRLENTTVAWIAYKLGNPVGNNT